MIIFQLLSRSGVIGGGAKVFSNHQMTSATPGSCPIGYQNFAEVSHEFGTADYESPNVKHDPGAPDPSVGEGWGEGCSHSAPSSFSSTCRPLSVRR
jgi:hypothetical protein